jgi:HK97 family phage prohead protease
MQMNKYTIRSIPVKFETRETDEGKHISGYFAVFNSNYEITPMMSESIDPHAFDSSLNGDIRALVNHNTDLVIGRTTNGTMKINVDEHGLFADVLINEKDSDAMNAWARVDRGDVNQCSFGCYITDEEYSTREDGGSHWVIKDMDLFEVSICTFPAYEATSIQARSADLTDVKKREIEAFKENMRTKLKGESQC